ncbi:hypothetical protein HanXRQr2_Chr17g0803831 [Helianthus annuus]|uniref:Transposase (putative) gypsy type domain-containing protein n=1 Tax=Helianthus annuus TaxID=4232 RepID=A0A9K3GUB6_HELAN|nr:hypothetical protein HanXRQr2_Chr17g0803831 [Helianthus annuus]KAJ0429242.1 hypothetical protein HanHA300_Chr17g0655091 [Helianthus annuus]KAJ0807742.1 hypothetical protein HanLR1_Chr00c1112g0790491 [Helianthus annuus]KAJ0813263.1 hypothetical protein HanPSC8_Chr17g0771421 [Helianthus annuus]
MNAYPKSTTSRKRKYKPKNPPGLDQAVINWKEDELNNLVQNFGLSSDWGIQFPTPNSTALDAPPRYMTLYADFFREGNFRLPMSNFIGEVLTGYGLHISQINALGLPRLTHFEFICRANRVEPSFEKFNTFYFVTYTGGFYSFNSRTGGVKPCGRDPPKFLHDSKHKFFYIRCGVIPIDMRYRYESEGIPRVNVSIDFTEQEWYTILTRKVTSIIQFEERALVAAGMSILWAPQNPRGFPVYGYRGKGDIDSDVNPTRGEPILLSSKESDDASYHLIHRSSRAGPQREPSEEPAVKVVPTPVVDPHLGAAEPSEMRKKKREEKVEEKTAEDPVDKRLETTIAPSELEIDLGVFSEKTGNRLEKIFNSASASRAPKSGRSVRKVDISNITPHASPPSKPLDLSHPRSDPKGKGKEDDVEVDRTEKLVEDVAAGARRDEVHAEGVETEVESSEATPQGTIYTKRVRSSGGGGASGIHQSPEYHRVQGGSWTTQNPSCDDLPHAPHWTLTQGSRMNDLSNYREFYSLSLPPAERLFQKNRHRMDLLDDHIHVGMNFYATTQEIVREWQEMGEDTLEFEAGKKEFAEEREAFNAEKKRLLWRVVDGEDKLAKEKQYNADRQKEWESACERSNRELKAAHDEVIRLKGEKTKLSDEHEQAVPMYQKRENEYTQRIAKLEKIAAEKTAESKASEILAEEASADCK